MSGLLDVDGQLYGTTEFGAEDGNENDEGTLFSLDPRTGVLTKWASFDGKNGANPGSALINVNGDLYGTTIRGGAANDGTIFSYNIATHTLICRASFHEFDGQSPAGLTNVNGTLYGLTMSGGLRHAGTVFSFNPFTSQITPLASLAALGATYAPASFPGSGGLLDVNGLLYGTTQFDGKYGGGMLFSFDPVTHALVRLADFGGATGVNPTSGLTVAHGLLYGTALNGGAYGRGAVFSYDPLSHVLSAVVGFSVESSPQLGGAPEAPLLPIGNLLYGTTTDGGARYAGAVFSLDPTTGRLALLADFDDRQGWLPVGPLAVQDGFLYGVAQGGGPRNEGIIFRLRLP